MARFGPRFGGGGVSAGLNRAELQQNMYEAIQLHIEGLREDGQPILTSSAVAEYVIRGA